ncbi:OLC1v1022834C1 [Oldenlandia corymbosa var. corymbosa]|uniref:OLC1v1022834C1 n=1 Tax=Oldenlandia corymbosa var. corymbosa TaxID=529605 RepID=A0AAV1C1K8_OLDCO|nr:OLC1v1022834C1 [Oldenlandia corymbosa var. corymbosa]
MGTNNGMFRYADRVDKILMSLGTLGSMGDGLQIPLMMFVLSDAINSYANPNTPLSLDVVNKFSLRLLYVAIGVGLSAFVEGLCWARTAERQTSRMRLEYLKSVLRQDVGFFDTQAADSSTTFQVVSTISADSNTIQTTIGEKIPDCLAYTSSFLFCVIFAFMLSWKVTLAGLPLMFTFIVPGLGFGTRMMNVAMKVIESYGVAGGIAEQAISSIRTVYSYVAENQTLEKFSHALETTMQLGIKQGLARGLMLGSMGGIYISWAFQAWLGSFLVSKKGEKGGDVFVAGFNILMGGLNILTTLPNLTAITEAKAAAIRITEMIDREPSIDTEDRKGKALSHVRGEIEFKGVYFSYPSRLDTPILQGIDLLFPAGKTVGLVGGSGSGKSTIVSLLQRFYDPIEGDIFLDGYKIKKLHLKWLRSQMGLVNQEPVLFATSIKENILFGKEGASLEDVQNAAKAANAHDFIMKLPEAYDSQVGQFGVQLSGGQKQRIAIARALLRDPKILLLDEATSALDTQSESIVQKAIDNASHGRTAVVIAHRLSTIRMADRIIVLQSGKVVESGRHDELMQISDGEYFKMVQLQKQTTQNDTDISYDYYNNDRSTPYRKSGTQSPYQRSNNQSPYHRSINQSPYIRSIPQSPMSVRSSGPVTPAMYALSPGFSRSAPFSSTPYSVQYDDYDSEDDEEFEQKDYPAPSQWRLLKMNALEWDKALLGCIGAIGSGLVQPINAYCVGAVISIYFRSDKSSIQSHARTYSFIFLGLAVFNFCVNVLQHYSFSVMGERLTKRVREKLLEKLMTFEIGWFDLDENTSAAICARISTEASMVRSLVGDRMSLLAQAFFGATFAYALGLYLTWKLALVMMAAQPLLIGSFYARTVLMKSMSAKAQIAQREGSQLASEAVINHRTITAFSSQKKIVGLFKQTLEGPRKESIRQSYFAGCGLFSSQFLAAASTALAFWYGGRLLTKDEIAPERLFQSFLALLFTAYIIAEAGSMTKDISRGSNAVSSVLAILDRKSEIDPEDPRGQDATKMSIKGQVELKHVHFSYPSRPDLMVLKGLSLKIAAGNTVALRSEHVPWNNKDERNLSEFNSYLIKEASLTRKVTVDPFE